MPTRARPSYYRDPPLLVFGARLRELREALGWSQAELAQRADRHWTHVSGVERGDRNVTLLTMLGFAKALEVDPAVLVAEDTELVQVAVRDLARRRAAPRVRRKPGDVLRE